MPRAVFDLNRSDAVSRAQYKSVEIWVRKVVPFRGIMSGKGGASPSRRGGSLPDIVTYGFGSFTSKPSSCLMTKE